MPCSSGLQPRPVHVRPPQRRLRPQVSVRRHASGSGQWLLLSSAQQRCRSSSGIQAASATGGGVILATRCAGGGWRVAARPRQRSPSHLLDCMHKISYEIALNYFHDNFPACKAPMEVTSERTEPRLTGEVSGLHRPSPTPALRAAWPSRHRQRAACRRQRPPSLLNEEIGGGSKDRNAASSDCAAAAPALHRVRGGGVGALGRAQANLERLQLPLISPFCHNPRAPRHHG